MLLLSPRPALQTGWLQEPETSDRPRPISRPSDPSELPPSFPRTCKAARPVFRNLQARASCLSPRRGIASLKIQQIRQSQPRDLDYFFELMATVRVSFVLGGERFHGRLNRSSVLSDVPAKATPESCRAGLQGHKGAATEPYPTGVAEQLSATEISQS